MRKTGMKFVAALALFTAASGPVHANDPPAPVARAAPITATTLDPALRRMMVNLGSAMLAGFAGSMAAGSPEAYDPGPLLEKTIRGALASREFNNVVDAIVAQALAGGGDGASALPPEMRALLAAGVKGLVGMARNEILREFSAGAAP